MKGETVQNKEGTSAKAFLSGGGVFGVKNLNVMMSKCNFRKMLMIFDNKV